MTNLSLGIKTTRVLNSVVAGTSEQISSAIDMQGFEGCRIVAAFGTLTSGTVVAVRVTQCDTSGGSYADLLGTSVSVADTRSNDLVVIDIFRPRERFLKVAITRTTQNAVIDGITAEQYGARKQPTTDDTTTVVSREVHVSPAEGTA